MAMMAMTAMRVYVLPDRIEANLPAIAVVRPGSPIEFVRELIHPSFRLIQTADRDPDLHVHVILTVDGDVDESGD